MLKQLWLNRRIWFLIDDFWHILFWRWMWSSTYHRQRLQMVNISLKSGIGGKDKVVWDSSGALVDLVIMNTIIYPFVWSVMWYGKGSEHLINSIYPACVLDRMKHQRKYFIVLVLTSLNRYHGYDLEDWGQPVKIRWVHALNVAEVFDRSPLIHALSTSTVQNKTR